MVIRSQLKRPPVAPSYPYNHSLVEQCTKKKYPFIVFCRKGQLTLVSTNTRYLSSLLAMCSSLIVDRNFCEDLVTVNFSSWLVSFFWQTLKVA